MVRGAVKEHAPFVDCSLKVYAKGSYANNTNVQTDSDVDIGVQCQEVMYWEEEKAGVRTGGTPYEGPWTPTKLRSELRSALVAKFGSDAVDDSGSTAFTIRSSSARVDADVVPCFDYRYYFESGGHRDGCKVFPTTGSSFVNYPDQQLSKGNAKNNRTGTLYKKAVRVMKRTENAMVADGAHREVPSFVIECLVYNCPDSVFARSTWTDRVSGILVHVWEGLQGDREPTNDDDRWLEVNECKYLFHSRQKWTRKDGRDFAYAAWNYLGYAK